MKKFVLPVLVPLLLAFAAFAQQSVSQQDNSQKEKAQQSNAQPENALPPSGTGAPQDNAAQPSGPSAPQDSAPQPNVQSAQQDNAPQPSGPSAPQANTPSPNPPQDNAEKDNVVEEIVARVNNSIITRAELRRNREQIAFDAKEQKLTQSQIEQRQENSLRDLIDQQLLVQKAAELGISADADLVKRLDEIRKQMNVGTIEELQKSAESQGVHWEEFKQNTKNTILTQKVIGSEVGARIQITREEAQKFYNEHKDDFTQPERVRISEILIANDPAAPKGSPVAAAPELVAAAQAKANQLYTQLKSGAKFDELARKESNGPTAEQGGDLGYFKRNDLAKTLEDQTFNLKSGEFTPPIQTRQGFIILKVNDHIEAGTPPFERVREQIHEQIYMQRVQPALREYLSKLRDDAYIDVKPGYTDAGASPNQSKLIYATDTGPKTKQVRGKLGVGKKKTVVVTGNEKSDESQAGSASASGSASGLGLAKAEAEAKEKAAQNRKTAEESAAAKAAAEAAENEKLSHMSNNEKARYLAQKKRQAEKDAKEEAKRKRKEEPKQKELAAKKAQRQSAEAKTAKNKKSAKSKEAAATGQQSAKSKSAEKTKSAKDKKSAEKAKPDKTSEQADSSQPPQKKKIHWF